MMQKFSKKEAIRFGWKLAKKNIKFFVLILIFVWGVGFGLDGIANEIKSFLLSFSLNIIGGILSIIFSLGLIRIYLDFCDEQKSRFSQIFSQYRLFFRCLFASILYNLICLLGLILLIVPGIIFGIRFGFFSYFIVDKNSGIIESLKRSWQITKGNTWNLFLFYVLLSLINFGGALALSIGLFWTVPTCGIATASVYRKLLSQA